MIIFRSNINKLIVEGGEPKYLMKNGSKHLLINVFVVDSLINPSDAISLDHANDFKLNENITDVKQICMLPNRMFEPTQYYKN